MHLSFSSGLLSIVHTWNVPVVVKDKLLVNFVFAAKYRLKKYTHTHESYFSLFLCLLNLKLNKAEWTHLSYNSGGSVFDFHFHLSSIVHNLLLASHNMNTYLNTRGYFNDRHFRTVRFLSYYYKGCYVLNASFHFVC